MVDVAGGGVGERGSKTAGDILFHYGELRGVRKEGRGEGRMKQGDERGRGDSHFLHQRG